MSAPLYRISRDLVRALDRLRFGPPVAYVYNPLVYARRPFRAYVERWGVRSRDILLVGMNPGPWGMAQTGVPFGAVELVRGWLGIEAPVDSPARTHPRRPVLGFACRRQEVSGSRLWGWARERFRTPDRFFARFFVWSYCPLLFYDAAGRNITPDRLPARERAALLGPCDRALSAVAEALDVRAVIGVGGFAEQRAREALDGRGLVLGRIPHPSPASPAANRGWAAAATRALARLGIEVP